MVCMHVFYNKMMCQTESLLHLLVQIHIGMTNVTFHQCSLSVSHVLLQ